MPRATTPITVFTRDTAEAEQLANQFPDARAMTSRPGSLKFHTLIAQHGAGEFKFLYVPVHLKGTFKPPAGGEVRHSFK